jgi:hypothetical protein
MNMNKNMMKKVILVLSLIALFSIVLGGCTIIGFVTIPDVPVGEIASGETLEVGSVSVGTHFFEARDVYYVYCYGSVTQKIYSGTNYVTIPVYLYSY